MKRLTEKQGDHYYYPYCLKKCGGNGATECCNDCEFQMEICDKLEKYENAEEMGRLLVEGTLEMLKGKKCTACGQFCYDDKFPEIVFQDDKNCICEECSINYEQDGGEVQLRED